MVLPYAHVDAVLIVTLSPLVKRAYEIAGRPLIDHRLKNMRPLETALQSSRQSSSTMPAEPEVPSALKDAHCNHQSAGLKQPLDTLLRQDRRDCLALEFENAHLKDLLAVRDLEISALEEKLRTAIGKL